MPARSEPAGREASPEALEAFWRVLRERACTVDETEALFPTALAAAYAADEVVPAVWREVAEELAEACRKRGRGMRYEARLAVALAAFDALRSEGNEG